MVESSGTNQSMQVADPLQYAVIAQRMQALEQQITSLGADKGNRAVAWILDLLKALVPGAVLAVIGFVLNDTVDHALKEHQLQIDAIKDMQSLSADLQKPDITRDEALARAAQLAAYGKYSTPFFINVLEIGNEYGGLGALQGLRMVARSEPEGVCQQAAAVTRNRTGLYGWQSHLAALQLLGEVRCVSASADVRDYQTSLTSLAILTTWVASPAPDQTEFDKLNLALQATVTRLSRPAPPPPSRGWFGQSH